MAHNAPQLRTPFRGDGDRHRRQPWELLHREFSLILLYHIVSSSIGGRSQERTYNEEGAVPARPARHTGAATAHISAPETILTIENVDLCGARRHSEAMQAT